MENEIIEEVDTEITNEITYDSNMVDTIEETESDSSYSEDELVSALLHLINQQREEDSSNSVSEVLDQEEAEPLLVQNLDTIDYTDLLISIDSRLNNLEATLSVSPEAQGLDTPLNQYDLTNILLLCVLGLVGISFLYRFIKDNLLHF